MKLSWRIWQLLVPCGFLLGCMVGATSQTSTPPTPPGPPATQAAVPVAVKASAGNIPVVFNLDKAQYVTLVIENQEGRRVRNLIAETKFPAGTNSLAWDGYDDAGRLVPAGEYKVRGLTHDGIKLVYEFAYNTAGNPPWFTPDRSGAWMADHSLPAGAVFLPKGVSPYGNGKPQVMLTGVVCESGDPTIFVDTTGQKVYGNHYFGWDGGVALARDMGPKGRADVVAYQLIGFAPDRVVLRAIARKTGGANPAEGIEIVSFQARNPVPREPANIGLSVAVYNDVAVVSVPGDNQLVLIDTKAKRVLSRVALDAPMGVSFDEQGNLFAISGKTVKQFKLQVEEKQAPSLGEGKDLITSDLEAPYNLTVDTQGGGNLFVVDLGKSHQVKVFSPAGKLLRTIGQPGGLQLGHYNEARMQHPNAVALDDQGQLWVAEFDAWPKRVSVWNAATGAFVKGLYGPPMYGGGGTIDAEDKTRLFYAQYGGLTEWKLDWEKGTAKLKSICVRRSMMGSPEEIERWHMGVGERPVHLNGRIYLIPTYSGFLRTNDNQPIYLLGEDGVAWPVAFIGTLRRWGLDGYDKLNDVMKLYPKYPNGKTYYDDVEVTWSDDNWDHKVQKEEFKLRVFPELALKDGQGNLKPLNRKETSQMFPDLSANLCWMLHIDAPWIDSRGIPYYDLQTIKPLLPIRAEYGGNEQGNGAVTTREGLILEWYTRARDKEGNMVWTYPTHGGDYVPQKGGDVVEVARIIGPLVVAPKGEAGEWFCMSGEKGVMYLMTSDGLFIQGLGNDMRVVPLLREPKAVRGMVIDSPEKHISFEDEHFHPSITQTKEGEIYLCAGKEFSAIFRVDGFENIKRITPAPVTVTPALLAGMPARLPVMEQKLVDKLPVILSNNPLKVDGDLTDWPANTVWAPLDPKASAALTVAEGKLYAAFKTGDPHAIDNDATNFQFMFKTGGALDIQVRPEPAAARIKTVLGQDRRLLMALVHGKPKAVLFYPETDKTPEAQKVLYESPIGKVKFDRVVDISDQVTLTQKDGNFEVSVPLSVLDLKPQSQMEVLGDIGIIRGNGTQNTQRLYWHNRNTGLVSDIPSEARLSPVNWGRFQFIGQPRAGEIKFTPQKAERTGRTIKLKGRDEDTYVIGFWSDLADYVQWSKVPVKAGQYDIMLTYSCGSKGGSFVVAVGGKSISGKTENTGGWMTYRTLKVGTVTLPEGPVTLSLKPVTIDGGLMDLKLLTLEKSK